MRLFEKYLRFLLSYLFFPNVSHVSLYFLHKNVIFDKMVMNLYFFKIFSLYVTGSYYHENYQVSYNVSIYSLCFKWSLKFQN